MAYPDKSADRDGALNALLDRAEISGYITYEDIAELASWADEDEDRMEAVVTALKDQGVEILDDETPLAETNDPEPCSGFSSPLEHISTDDTVGLYLKEMSRVPLLSLEEELSLATRIERGREAKQKLDGMKSKGPARRKSELEGCIQDGILAREHLIKANTRLVVSIAKKYMSRGVPFLDLIQEGNLGLMKSIEKYDYKRGFRFSTYATWWIRQTITRSIADQSRTIRVPVHMTDRIRQIYKVSHELEQQLGHPPSMEELGQKMQVEPRRLQWILQVAWTPISLESPVGDDEEAEFGMFVEDDITPAPAQLVSQSMLREKVEEVLATLTPREARIIRLRFGLDNDRPYTLEEVGRKFGLTRERIRQIEGKALRRLRHPCRARILREYL